jgi:RimJ/RimL family protein N-acetyltransferase
MIVRPLEWGDFEDLVATYYQCYEERDRGEPIGIHLFAERPTPADEAQWFAGLYRRTLEREAVVSVAEVDGTVVGSCTIGRIAPRADSENGHVGELGILVRQSHRGQGIGTALLADAIGRARGLFSVVRLSVFATNVRARELYARIGFQPAGRIPRGIRRAGTYIDEDLMVLPLSD